MMHPTHVLIVGSIISLSTASACSGTEGSEVGEESGVETEGTGSSASGQDGELYYSEVCAECHGEFGDGLDGLGPDIKHPVEDYSLFVIRNGRVSHMMYEDDMPGSPAERLPEAILAGIMEFLANQPRPTDGEGLYLDYCAACHGADGLGGPTARSLEMHVADVEKLVRNGHVGDFLDRREYMPSWTQAELSDTEVELIHQYVSSLF